ncbi:MAG: glycosyltransferase [Muribaculum sp.]|nr:glycosyltransferase [Muribaculum sp.]
MGEITSHCPKRLVFISKSDLRGGAAIVTFRLVESLRKMGYDARMLVCEKLSDAQFVEVCHNKLYIKGAFIKERLEVFFQNGFDRETLFKIDPASTGLPLWRHPWVIEADAVILGWVNQGMLSLKGVRRICGLEKPVVWIMHDMWNMTGICHHAGNCTGFLHKCGDCPLLGEKASLNDLSHKIWENKEYSYAASPNLKFVAVSAWLADKAKESRLMQNLDVRVIPNVFEIEDFRYDATQQEGPVRIIFGGARLDDPIKGLPVLKKALKIIKERYPAVANDMQLVTFGEFKIPESNTDFALDHTHLGTLKGHEALRNAYTGCSIVVSTSDYETLPGTLIEGQAYGCIPVATDHGGQRDIIEHQVTGWLAPWNECPSIRAEEIAKGLIWAYGIRKGAQYPEFKSAMRDSVKTKFSASKVASEILNLISQR